MKKEEEAFLRAFQEHSDALFRHAFFRVSARERALDLTQEVFLKGWDYLRKGGDIRDAKNFLFRIMHNLIIDEYRKSKSDSLDELLDVAGDAVEAQFSEGSLMEVEDAVDERTLIEQIKEKVHALPDEYKTAVMLRFFEGLTPKEIAKITHVSENVVSVRIHRALIKLRAEFQ